MKTQSVVRTAPGRSAAGASAKHRLCASLGAAVPHPFSRCKQAGRQRCRELTVSRARTVQPAAFADSCLGGFCTADQMVSTAVFDTLAAVILLAVALLGKEICIDPAPRHMCSRTVELSFEPCRIARPAQLHEASLALQGRILRSCFMSGARRQAHLLAEASPMSWATCSVPEVRACHACASAALQNLTDQEQIKGCTSSRNLWPPCCASWLAVECSNLDADTVIPARGCLLVVGADRVSLACSDGVSWLCAFAGRGSA